MTADLEMPGQVQDILVLHDAMPRVDLRNIEGRFQVIFAQQSGEPSVRRMAIVPACGDVSCHLCHWLLSKRDGKVSGECGPTNTVCGDADFLRRDE